MRLSVGYWVNRWCTDSVGTRSYGGAEPGHSVDGGEDALDPGVRFSVEPSDAVVVPGDAALLACSAASSRALRLHWRHSATAPPTRDHAISDTDKYRKQLSNGSLWISEMSASLAGHYQCVASVDGVGTIVSRVALVFLAEVPEVVGGPRSVLGAAGSAALLPCGVRAPARLALRLLAAPPDRRVYGAARLHAAPPVLNLNAARALDAGAYTCRAHSRLDSADSSAHLAVLTPPRALGPPAVLQARERGDLTLRCDVRGRPPPAVVWLKDGDPLTPNNHDIAIVDGYCIHYYTCTRNIL
ncbi:hypothetical protein HF086_012351 [Spodoptera exigua]|uniref:Ig-like domain-containing protein n=1 Tax=Spodoptera exigua TaxID=7107 RepID=A0A922M9U7_SPOEX|nr:hypothetical protein HF086_012351 [Spodoptera exigua]